MKIKLTYLCLLAVAFTAAQAQTDTPPVKMGLWKTTSVMTMSGFQVPPDVAARMKAMGRTLGEPQTINTLSCVTAEKWKKIFDPSQHDQKCQFTNQQQSSSGMSADMTCNSGARSSTGHMSMTFDSKEKMHGKFHMEVNSQSQPHPILMDNTFTGDYQGSDCQGISPDSPKMLP